MNAPLDGDRTGASPPLLRGSCACGAVAYTVPDDFRYALNCHCSQCRKATGSAFKPFAGIESSRLTLARGGDETMRVGDGDDYDTRCGRCGSLLYSIVRDGRFAHVTLGTLIDPPSIRPSAHIFTGSKAPWFEISDSLPQLDAFE